MTERKPEGLRGAAKHDDLDKLLSELDAAVVDAREEHGAHTATAQDDLDQVMVGLQQTGEIREYITGLNSEAALSEGAIALDVIETAAAAAEAITQVAAPSELKSTLEQLKRCQTKLQELASLASHPGIAEKVRPVRNLFETLLAR